MSGAGFWTCSQCGTLVPNGCAHHCLTTVQPNPLWTPGLLPQVTVGPTWQPMLLPQRARLILAFDEYGERVHSAGVGWAKRDGDWMLWLGDQNDGVWQSWPRERVVYVEWLNPEQSSEGT